MKSRGRHIRRGTTQKENAPWLNVPQPLRRQSPAAGTCSASAPESLFYRFYRHRDPAGGQSISILATIYRSFTNWDGLYKSDFVGLANYKEFFGSGLFMQLFKTTSCCFSACRCRSSSALS
jgi:hypothetical protein